MLRNFTPVCIRPFLMTVFSCRVHYGEQARLGRVRIFCLVVPRLSYVERSWLPSYGSNTTSFVRTHKCSNSQVPGSTDSSSGMTGIPTPLSWVTDASKSSASSDGYDESRGEARASSSASFREGVRDVSNKEGVRLRGGSVPTGAASRAR
mgnify:CR=1 FL=1